VEWEREWDDFADGLDIVGFGFAEIGLLLRLSDVLDVGFVAVKMV
jgi:hypothetical protein